MAPDGEIAQLSSRECYPGSRSSCGTRFSLLSFFLNDWIDEPRWFQRLPKNVRESAFLSRIPDQFKNERLEISFKNPARFTEKLRKYYNDRVLFRGHFSTVPVSNQDALAFFYEEQPILASNNGFLSLKDHDQPLRATVTKDLDSFNFKLDQPENFFSAVLIHNLKPTDPHGDVYRTPFVSTSTKRETACFFARKCGISEASLVGGTQIVVTSLEPRYGAVDIVKMAPVLKELQRHHPTPELASFRPLITHENEVLVSGGIDPDSIIEVEIRDRNFIRNFTRVPGQPGNIALSEKAPNGQEIRREVMVLPN